MLGRRDRPFPRESVRDLLGVTRGMWRAEKAAAHPSPLRLERLRKIGEALTSALELAASSPEESVGQRAAWKHAEDAIAALGREISILEALEPVVREARRAVAPTRGGRG